MSFIICALAWEPTGEPGIPNALISNMAYPKMAYDKTTYCIRVSVAPRFLEDQSSPDNDQYFWAYKVTIENQGDRTVQLRSRAWSITDATGNTQEIRGPGVVGKQPVLRPGDRFEYTSGAPLATPSGIMVGCYRMEGEDGKSFDVSIPAFSLDSPHQPIRLN